MSTLDNLRKKIDAIDDQILKLLAKRGDLALKIGTIKKKAGQEIYVPSREKKIFQRLTQKNLGPYSNETICALFREIIAATRSLEEKQKIAYLGPQATFTHLAAQSYFGASSDLATYPSVDQVFNQVERGHFVYGVVPVENSTEGVVNHTLDCFIDTSLKVCAEVVLKIEHHLLAKTKDLKKIKTVYSHPQALAQCRRWLNENLPHAKRIDCASTALAAQKAQKTITAAAIASPIAASEYGLTIIKSKIQDQTNNFTRFLVIGKSESSPTKQDKTSLLMMIDNSAGSLAKTLKKLADAKVNLTKIESRPIKKKAWQYLFFIDLDGHQQDPKVARVLEQIKKQASFFKILGSYPKAYLG